MPVESRLAKTDGQSPDSVRLISQDPCDATSICLRNVRNGINMHVMQRWCRRFYGIDANNLMEKKEPGECPVLLGGLSPGRDQFAGVSLERKTSVRA